MHATSADSSLRTDTTAAPAGTAAGERQSTVRPGMTMIQDELTEAEDGVKDSSEAADGDSTCLPLPATWIRQQWREYLAYLIVCDVRGKGDKGQCMFRHYGTETRNRSGIHLHRFETEFVPSSRVYSVLTVLLIVGAVLYTVAEQDFNPTVGQGLCVLLRWNYIV